MPATIHSLVTCLASVDRVSSPFAFIASIRGLFAALIRHSHFVLLSFIARHGMVAGYSTAVFAGCFIPDGATTMHFAFEGQSQWRPADHSATRIFHGADGFGFVDSPSLAYRAGRHCPEIFPLRYQPARWHI